MGNAKGRCREKLPPSSEVLRNDESLAYVSGVGDGKDGLDGADVVTVVSRQLRSFGERARQFGS